MSKTLRSTDRLRLLPVLFLLASFLLAGVGCTEAERARSKARTEKLQRQMAEKMLKERVDEYWDFARWYTWSETARFFELTVDQREHLELGTGDDQGLLPKMDMVEILYIYVDPDERKTGTVKVRWKEVVTHSTEVVEKSVTQSWYKRGGQWWLAPPAGIPDDEYDELGDADRAPPVEPVPDLETVEAPATADR